MTALLLLVSLSWADEPKAAWTTRSVSLQRWADADIPVAEVDADARVEVLFVEGTKTRVRRGMDFGWVPSDALTTKEPPLPTFDPPADDTP
jgi:hypothetical protein